MSERDIPPQKPEENPPSAASPPRGRPESASRDEGDERERRRLASAAFGGAGQGDGIHFGCPECGHAIAVEARDAGARVACPACGASIDVPHVVPPRQRGPGAGVMRPASLPNPRPKAEGMAAVSEVANRGEAARQSHDDQHRLNPDRKLKFIPFEGEVPDVYGEEGGSRGHAGPAQGPGWIRITLGVLGALALGAGIYAFLTHTKGKPAEIAPGSGESQLSPEIENLLDFYGRFREATSPEARAAFVRHPDITLPRLLAYYQLRGFDPPSPMLLPHTATTVTEGGVEFIRCEAQFKGQSVQAYFEKLANGSFLVDWESLVAYSDDEWGFFVASIPGDPQEFRVFLSGDEFFGDEFPDSAKASCARLHHLDGGNHVFGYVTRGSELDGLLAELVKQADENPERMVPCRARIRFVRPEKNGRQVEILSLTPGWLVPVEETPAPEAPSEGADLPGVPDDGDATDATPSEDEAGEADDAEPEPGEEDEAVPRALPPSTDTRTEVIPSALPLDPENS